VIEQLFDYEQGRGLSTAQILLDANAQNIPIVHVTAANYGEWADTLNEDYYYTPPQHKA